MSDLKSVLSFFVGLVFFVLIIAFVLGRLRLPSRTTNTTGTIIVTPTPLAKKSLWDTLFGWMKPKTTPTPGLEGGNVTYESAQTNITPTTSFYERMNPDGSKVYTIPETGAPLFIIPLAMGLGGTGIFLRKKK